ncbi:MAG: hypothetical protein BroJett030_05130 [Alphaproteobacteria bacterium]|nr:MAG: hypothetical protein BroJett030_05130 [Alphaproteobacteria bacterium]
MGRYAGFGARLGKRGLGQGDGRHYGKGGSEPESGHGVPPGLVPRVPCQRERSLERFALSGSVGFLWRLAVKTDHHAPMVDLTNQPRLSQ